MKTYTKIMELTKTDIECLLSTSLYGSSWLGASTNIHEDDDGENGDISAEEHMAKLLLSGKPIYITDFYAEGEVYGNLPHEIDEDDESVTYKVTVEDIMRGLERAIDSDDNYAKECVRDMADEDGVNFDITEAEVVMQWILFGEQIYG